MNINFLKISRFKEWLKILRHSFLVLFYAIKLRCPFKIIKYQLINLLTSGLIYPLVRPVLGYKKTHNVCDSLEMIFCSPEILSLPSPLKSKILILKQKSDYMMYLEIYLDDIYHMKTLRRGMNIVDVGSHIGTYTILAAEKVDKKGKVISIEPEPKNYKQLLQSIKLNNYQNVIPVNTALSDHEGFEKLYLSPFSWGHSLLFKENATSSIEVPTKTLDNLLEELNFKRIDIIKIDAEGAEMPILKGAKTTLKANPNMKIIIASYHYPSEAKEVCQFLNERNFKTEAFPGGIIMTA